jgi:ABC-2 type transport system permease protein
MTYVVEAERALFAGQFPADVVISGFVAAAVVAVGGVLVGVRTMERSS